jgi:hypothetical protein
MTRLSAALTSMGDVMGEVHRLFLDTEDAVNALFMRRDLGEGTAVNNGNPQTANKVPAAKVVNFDDYQTGFDFKNYDGIWWIANINADKLLTQKGNTCGFYGALNLLNESGYSVNQPIADMYVIVKRGQVFSSNPAAYAGVGLPEFVPMSVTEGVVADFTPHYQTGNFDEVTASGAVVPNQAKAEQFLIDKAKAGQPVLIDMQMDDSFGVVGGHVATVVGVKMGLNGKVKDVLVSTNWSNGQFQEIPAKQFMDDWLEHEGGRFITVDPLTKD